MPGFEKIDLDLKNDTMTPPPSMARKAKRQTFFSKNIKAISIAAVVFVLLLVFGFILPMLSVLTSAKHTYAQAKILEAAVKQQNISAASDELAKTQAALQDTQNKMRILGYLHFVPIANFYYNDASHLVNAGTEGLKTAAIVVDALKPYADVLGLKGQGSFVGGSAEDRIKTAVLTMGKITPEIDQINQSLVKVKSEVDQVNPNHYPAFLFGSKIKTQLTSIRSLTDDSVEFVDQARPLIKVLPSLLGESEPKKYLVIFQNDKELRPTGGFITAYAIFTLDKGVIHLDRSDDIYTLDDSIPNKPAAPAPILKYLPKVYTFNLRDSNLSPDFIESMKTFKSLYNKAGQRVDVDGIIAIDTYVLTSTIKVLDNQINVDGQTFTTDNDSRCDCAQVIYALEDSISRPVGYIKTDRKGLLGDMLSALMSKALSSSPKVYWGPLFQSMLAQTHQKHILFDLNDTNAQSGVESLQAAGRIIPFDGDYLHINEANFSGAKTNLFIDQTVDDAYSVKSDGTITKTVTINYKDTHAPSDCNLEHGDLCLNALYRDWIRVYVPKGSKLVDSKGNEVKVSTYDELGKTVFDSFITVRPLGATTYTLTYTLPFKVQNGQLPLLIQKQPGTDAPEYTITTNGHIVQKFDLSTDQKVKVNL
ncbi:MAG TPA: DUF4012 domain-containing protein [Patescibacteria group bacterium]|nr:DUF4012 domain-containing protein [Patescibacteria group bacterium]